MQLMRWLLLVLVALCCVSCGDDPIAPSSTKIKRQPVPVVDRSADDPEMP